MNQPNRDACSMAVGSPEKIVLSDEQFFTLK